METIMELTWAASRILYQTDYERRHGRITADTPVRRWHPDELAICADIKTIAYSSVVATVQPDPTYVLGVAGKTIGMNQYPTLDKAMAEAKRLANKENAVVNVYDSRHRLEQFQASHYIVETVLPDNPKTLAYVEPHMVYRRLDGGLAWKDSVGTVLVRNDNGDIWQSDIYSGNVSVTGPCLGHVRDVLRLAEHLDPAANGCRPLNHPETPDSCPKTLADVPPLHCYQDHGGFMVWRDRRGVAMFRSSDGIEFECIGKPEDIRIVGPRINL